VGQGDGAGGGGDVALEVGPEEFANDAGIAGVLPAAEALQFFRLDEERGGAGGGGRC
jgi:hypothetical protein